MAIVLSGGARARRGEGIGEGGHRNTRLDSLDDVVTRSRAKRVSAIAGHNESVARATNGSTMMQNVCDEMFTSEVIEH